MRKRSITIHGHQTSISLEDEFWQELAALAKARNLSLNALVTEVDKARHGARDEARNGANLSSTLRVYVLKQTKRKISRA
jgi:predicted DNA-binding ribbon-helix-helix protein